MSERFKVLRVPHYVVVDAEVAEDAPLKLHYLGPDKDFAEQLAADMNERHQNALDAQERIQREAVEARELEIKEHGLGADR